MRKWTDVGGGGLSSLIIVYYFVCAVVRLMTQKMFFFFWMHSLIFTLPFTDREREKRDSICNLNLEKSLAFCLYNFHKFDEARKIQDIYSHFKLEDILRLPAALTILCSCCWSMSRPSNCPTNSSNTFSMGGPVPPWCCCSSSSSSSSSAHEPDGLTSSSGDTNESSPSESDCSGCGSPKTVRWTKIDFEFHSVRVLARNNIGKTISQKVKEFKVGVESWEQWRQILD